MAIASQLESVHIAPKQIVPRFTYSTLYTALEPSFWRMLGEGITSPYLLPSRGYGEKILAGESQGSLRRAAPSRWVCFIHLSCNNAMLFCDSCLLESFSPFWAVG